MAPKMQKSDGGNPDTYEKDWEYAGKPELEWTTWKEHGNDKGENWTEHGSQFEYRDSNNIGAKSHEFPDVGYQELPEKM